MYSSRMRYEYGVTKFYASHNCVDIIVLSDGPTVIIPALCASQTPGVSCLIAGCPLLPPSQVETFSLDRSGMRSVGSAKVAVPAQHFPHQDGLRTRRSASLP
jgi:hypothetical protein